MAYKKLHDLKKNFVTVAEIPLDGVVSIDADYQEDQFSASNGTNGARLVKNNNLTGTVTIVLSPHSTSHALLMALYNSDVSFPIKHVDKTTSALAPTGFLADECRLTKPPPVHRESDPTDIEYVFVCVNLAMTHGSPADQ